jgi:hypothetical protein
MQKKMTPILNAFLIGVLTLMVGGCVRKPYVHPKIPTTFKNQKALETDVFCVSQGEITEKDISRSLNEAPQNILAASVQVRNKSNRPLILEIDRTNVATYDAEDLSLIFSKIAVEYGATKDVTLGYDVARFFTIGVTGGLAVALAGEIYRLFKKDNRVVLPGRPTLNNLALGGLAALTTLPIIAIGSYAYNAISAARTDIVECEQEKLIEHFRQVFESTVLAFDDRIEIAPRSSLEQVIFYDTKPAVPGGPEHRELVLRVMDGETKSLVPLRL